MRFNRLAMGAAALLALALAACDSAPPPAPAPAPKAVTPAKPVAPANPAQATADEIAKEVGAVQALLKKKYPTLQLQGISRIAIGDSVLYEFSAGGIVGYTNLPVNFVMLGEVVTVIDGQVINLTKSRAVQAGAQVYKVLGEMAAGQGLTYTYGAGEREFILFSDPDCPFCQDFEKELDAAASVVNARVTVLPYVLPNLHPNGVAHAKHIWCTVDPRAAWKSWMTTAAGHENLDAVWAKWAAANPAVANCPAASLVDKVMEAGLKMGFNQTPTMMFKNGMTWPGAPSMDELQEALTQVQVDFQQATPTPVAPAATAPAAPAPVGAAPAGTAPAGTAPAQPAQGVAVGEPNPSAPSQPAPNAQVPPRP